MEETQREVLWHSPAGGAWGGPAVVWEALSLLAKVVSFLYGHLLSVSSNMFLVPLRVKEMYNSLTHCAGFCLMCFTKLHNLLIYQPRFLETRPPLKPWNAFSSAVLLWSVLMIWCTSMMVHQSLCVRFCSLLRLLPGSSRGFCPSLEQKTQVASKQLPEESYSHWKCWCSQTLSDRAQRSACMRVLWRLVVVELRVGNVWTWIMTHRQQVWGSHCPEVFRMGSRADRPDQKENLWTGSLGKNWTTSFLEPNFSDGVTFDVKIFCSVWLGVLE